VTDASGADACALPTIVSFAGGGVMYAGHATTLTPTFNNGTGSIDPGFPSVTSGVTVATAIINATTTYILTVTNACGPVTAQVTVTVLPTPITVASGPGAVYAIAADATSVYWTNSYSGTVMKVSSGGGIAATLASGQNSPGAIAVDASDVYWTANDGTVMEAPLGGGTLTTLASGQYCANAIAVDNASVYWTTCGQAPADGGTTTPGTGTVMKVATGGGDLTTLASGQDDPTAIAVDANSVYWNFSSADLGTGLMKVAVGGGSPVTLALALGVQIGPIVVDAAGVYWLSQPTGTPPIAGVLRIALAGSAPVTLTPGWVPPIQNSGLAIDASNFYWADSAGTRKVALTGGAPVILALGSPGVPAPPATGRTVAVDATSVYWATSTNSGGIPPFNYTIMKTAK
jgi:sugar lactone lactonase YvrE